MPTRDKATNQLNDFKATKKQTDRCTTGTGAPVGLKTATMTVGPRGPVLLQDFVFTDEMAHFNRERIPERVVHAKGAGAYGYFECTHDITKYTKAAPFQKIGKKTPLVVRYSTVGGESGSADTARDPRGFAVKFYTEEGNWDLVGNNTPIFFIRDPILFPSFIHTQKRNPQTHLKDPDMFWDFITLRPETTHQVCFLFSDRGTPDGYRHMNGYGSHTFKMVNKEGKPVYCKFHFKTDQKIKNLMADKAHELSANDPDYAIRDMYNAIADGDFPSWTLKIQVMTFEQAETYRYNPFDLTKVWPQSEFPLIEVGKMVLDRNPANYFVDVEQSAFSPAHMIPGIEASPDKMLQGRLFSYSDTHRHRLGTNYLQIPVNCPYKARTANYQRDGPQCVDKNQGGAPNYFPNSFSGPIDDPDNGEMCPFSLSGDVKRYNSADEDNYSQVTTFWNKVLNEKEKQRLVENIGNHLCNASDFLQDRAVKNFGNVHPDFGKRLRNHLNMHKSKMQDEPIKHKPNDKHIEKLFKELVDNGDGTISREGVTHLLRIAGNNPTQDDIDDMFDEIGTKKINLEQFQSYYSRRFKNLDETQLLLNAFKTFDPRRANFIYVDEFKKYMQHYGEQITDEEAKEMFKLASNSNGHGKLYYRELAEFLTQK